MLGKWACLYSLITLWVPVSNGNLLAQNTVQLDESELIEVEDLSESLSPFQRCRRQIRAQAGFPAKRIPYFIGHPADPQHFTTVDVVGPGSAAGPVEFLGGLEVKVVAPLRFDIIGQAMGHPAFPIQLLIGSGHAGK